MFCLVVVKRSPGDGARMTQRNDLGTKSEAPGLLKANPNQTPENRVSSAPSRKCTSAENKKMPKQTQSQVAAKSHFTPWTGIPEWLRQARTTPRGFSADYLTRVSQGTAELVDDPMSTADQLGCFLESTQLYHSPPGLNFHNICHELIATYEYNVGSGYEGAEMDSFDTAHYNDQFGSCMSSWTTWTPRGN